MTRFEAKLRHFEQITEGFHEDKILRRSMLVAYLMGAMDAAELVLGHTTTECNQIHACAADRLGQLGFTTEELEQHVLVPRESSIDDTGLFRALQEECEGRE